MSISFIYESNGIGKSYVEHIYTHRERESDVTLKWDAISIINQQKCECECECDKSPKWPEIEWNRSASKCAQHKFIDKKSIRSNSSEPMKKVGAKIQRTKQPQQSRR